MDRAFFTRYKVISPKTELISPIPIPGMAAFGIVEK
jgi:hypothetical protein